MMCRFGRPRFVLPIILLCILGRMRSFTNRPLNRAANFSKQNEPHEPIARRGQFSTDPAA